MGAAGPLILTLEPTSERGLSPFSRLALWTSLGPRLSPKRETISAWGNRFTVTAERIGDTVPGKTWDGSEARAEFSEFGGVAARSAAAEEIIDAAFGGVDTFVAETGRWEESTRRVRRN